MKYLLDTNACVSHLRSKSSNVSKHLLDSNAGEVALCSVVKAELIFGARRSQRPDHNLGKLSRFFGQFQSFPFDDEAAEAYGASALNWRKRGQ
ncbi:MAG TPA: type II toxin-antitoxin system VapC family toxin [Acidobacteriota bacterium]|nr:type II toxin-antitoxin system VapC family toxin [Acidobacteriota bacterium]